MEPCWRSQLEAFELRTFSQLANLGSISRDLGQYLCNLFLERLCRSAQFLSMEIASLPNHFSFFAQLYGSVLWSSCSHTVARGGFEEQVDFVTLEGQLRFSSIWCLQEFGLLAARLIVPDWWATANPPCYPRQSFHQASTQDCCQMLPRPLSPPPRSAQDSLLFYRWPICLCELQNFWRAAFLEHSSFLARLRMRYYCLHYSALGRFLWVHKVPFSRLAIL